MILSKINLRLWSAIFLSTLTLSSNAQETPARWYEEGRAVVERNLSYRYANAEIPIAKNVILFIETVWVYLQSQQLEFLLDN